MAKRKQQLGPLQIKWVEALESGKYKQAYGYLRTKKGYCCLGVACVVNGERVRVRGAQTLAHKNTLHAFTFHGPEGNLRNRFMCESGSLAAANDGGLVSFADIAAFIRKYPEAVFSEAR